jgi:hypothetical protein
MVTSLEAGQFKNLMPYLEVAAGPRVDQKAGANLVVTVAEV